MIRITNLRVPVEQDKPLNQIAAARLKVPVQAVREVIVAKMSVDARRKNNICFVFSLYTDIAIPEGQVLARLAGDRDIATATLPVPEPIVPGGQQLGERPIVVGLGPAGLLAALTLAEYGYKPLVLERGRDVDSRTADVSQFWREGKLDTDSNVQFGEGGAGTFSDGKLTTRVQDPGMAAVMDKLIEAGAPADIRYLHKPHIGTDKLRHVVKMMRNRVSDLGGEVRFSAQVTDITVEAGTIKGLTVNNSEYIPCRVVLLGIGHSARDTYAMLFRHNVAMEAKPFAVGVRIEHPQILIDQSQYGQLAGHPNLGAADYALVYHAKDTGRTAYSFCMCPGGLVVASASEVGGVVTNGMSLYSRASGIANSALAVNVNPADCGNGVLGGIEFQRRYEQAAFLCGGGNYHAPIQTVGDFLAGKTGSKSNLASPTYRPGVKSADLRQCLPAFVTDTLAQALPDFGRKIKGFAHPDAVMTGVETRTSAPVRIVRGDNYMSLNVSGLYPIGEGAGYAGGIMSAALDGRNAAAAVIKQYKPF